MNACRYIYDATGELDVTERIAGKHSDVDDTSEDMDEDCDCDMNKMWCIDVDDDMDEGYEDVDDNENR